MSSSKGSLTKELKQIKPLLSLLESGSYHHQMPSEIIESYCQGVVRNLLADGTAGRLTKNIHTHVGVKQVITEMVCVLQGISATIDTAITLGDDFNVECLINFDQLPSITAQREHEERLAEEAAKEAEANRPYMVSPGRPRKVRPEETEEAA